MYENLLLTVENGIATVSINRPKSMNSLTGETFQELKDAFQQCDRDDAVRVVVITGTGKNFSSGGDIDMFRNMLSHGATYEDSKRDALLAGEMTYAARQCAKPIIAAVNGACFGAGLSLALACDFRIVDGATRMSTAFINVGFSGDTGTIFHLKEMIGFSRMIELMMTGRILEADEIVALGLASQKAGDGMLMETVYNMAERLAKGPTATYAKQKKLFWEYFCRDYDLYADIEAKYMAESTQTQDFQEAVAAFLEKRKPNFTGK